MHGTGYKIVWLNFFMDLINEWVAKDTAICAQVVSFNEPNTQERRSYQELAAVSWQAIHCPERICTRNKVDQYRVHLKICV